MINEAKIDEEPRFRLSDIFRTIREGILIVGTDMCVSASNEAADEAFGRDSSSLKGMRLSEVIRDFVLHKAFKKAIKKKKSSEVRIEILGKDRKIFDVVVSPLDLSDEYAAICLFYDVTRVESLERVRQVFLSNISHELRTPLTSILAFVETLEQGAIDDDENKHRFLEIIKKNGERMNLLVDDISELSSIEAGQVRVSPAMIDAAKLADELISSLSSQAQKRKITVTNAIPEGTKVYADVVRLHQMLTNLVVNAIKFNNPGGNVTISAESLNEDVAIHVVDDGEGISREHQQRIFERFYRVDKARSREVGGTGLGLAIVKHLARLHGGEVRVSSQLGKGTDFSIVLPKR
ncbi:MAG: PAS domain-containing protein [Pyrinomonadaceae bacterium]|nr:PAS domain-containing protein [Pyrinomonadaceae bacterium]